MCRVLEQYGEEQYKTGIRKGMEQGIQQGMQQGHLDERRRIILGMKAMNMDDGSIARLLSITADEVKAVLR